MNAKRNITSDDSTIVYKIGFPAFFSLAGIIGTIVGFFNIHGDLWFFIILWPVAVVWLLWFASRLKWVSVDEHFIYASGFKKEIQIPLSDVDRVEASYAMRPKQITLWLKLSSEFGKKIVFIPEQRVFESMREGHPLVDELKALVKSEPE